MPLFSKQLDSFGLDVSDLSLKIAKLEQVGSSMELKSFSEASIPSGVIAETKVVKEDQLSQIIKGALAKVKGDKLKTKKITASLPEEKSFIDVFQIPQVQKEELDAAVRFEAQNHIPMALDDVYFDFEVITPEKEKQKLWEVLIAASPKDIVDSYLTAFKKAGLLVVALEVECFSLARALIKKDQVQPPLLIIDFGESRTSFMIFSGRSLKFTSTIPVSSLALTQTIAQKLSIDVRAAETLKKQEGLLGRKRVLNIILPLLTDFTAQISTHLKYYQSHQRKNGKTINPARVEKILLCGGGANLKGLADFLSQALHLSVELANPWINILKQPLKQVPGLSFERSLGFATALGLALRSIYGD